MTEFRRPWLFRPPWSWRISLFFGTAGIGLSLINIAGLAGEPSTVGLLGSSLGLMFGTTAFVSALWLRHVEHHYPCGPDS